MKEKSPSTKKVINRIALSIFSLLALSHAFLGIWWLAAWWFFVLGVYVISVSKNPLLVAFKKSWVIYPVILPGVFFLAIGFRVLVYGVYTIPSRDTVITQFSDSSYFSDIRSMQIFNNRIYLTDYQRNQIIILNENGQFVESMGTEGKGPGELLGAANLFVVNDSIYVFLNDSGRSFELYGFKSGHIKKINFPVNSAFRSTQRFAVKNGKIFISSPAQKTSIGSLGEDGVSYNAFGRIIEFDSDIQTRVQNSRHLVVTDSNLFAISRTLPILEKYNFNGQLISVYDFSSVNIVKKRLDFVKTQRVQPNTSYILVADIYLYEDKLYLLIVSNDSQEVNSNKVLVMDLSQNRILPEKIYNLGEDWYGKIAVNKNSLWAYSDKQANIIKFSM